jgi:hypothetical protein
MSASRRAMLHRRVAQALDRLSDANFDGVSVLFDGRVDTRDLIDARSLSLPAAPRITVG